MQGELTPSPGESVPRVPSGPEPGTQRVLYSFLTGRFQPVSKREPDRNALSGALCWKRSEARFPLGDNTELPGRPAGLTRKDVVNG